MKNATSIITILFYLAIFPVYSQVGNDNNNNNNNNNNNDNNDSVSVVASDTTHASTESVGDGGNVSNYGTLLSVSGNAVRGCKIGEKLFVKRTGTTDLEGWFVYINTFPIAKLVHDNGDSCLYSFILNNGLQPGDSITKLINPKSKSIVRVNV